MARVSKKVSAAQREAENTPHRIWKTAIYARLSDFDDVLRYGIAGSADFLYQGVYQPPGRSDAAGCVCGQAVHRNKF